MWEFCHCSTSQLRGEVGFSLVKDMTEESGEQRSAQALLIEE